MILEISYGLASNSLGLLTDGAHMFLDCLAIVIGMYSSYVTNKPSNKSFAFGFVRAEVIGSFINGVFLVFISLYIVLESLERFIQPKSINTENIVLISFIGLAVNVIGMVFLKEIHGHHGHNHSENCNHSKSKQYVDVEMGDNNSNSNLIKQKLRMSTMRITMQYICML